VRVRMVRVVTMPVLLILRSRAPRQR